jgi:hypothetical protein
VAQLLTQARAFHAAYRALANNKQRYRDLAAQDAHIQAALSKRLEAHQLDPDGLDSAWEDDRAQMKGLTSQQLEVFYLRTLNQPDRPVMGIQAQK